MICNCILPFCRLYFHAVDECADVLSLMYFCWWVFALTFSHCNHSSWLLTLSCCTEHVAFEMTSWLLNKIIPCTWELSVLFGGLRESGGVKGRWREETQVFVWCSQSVCWVFPTDNDYFVVADCRYNCVWGNTHLELVRPGPGSVMGGQCRDKPWQGLHPQLRHQHSNAEEGFHKYKTSCRWKRVGL